MVERIEEIEAEAKAAVEAADSASELEETRVRFLGRKAELTGILRGIADLPPEQRGPVGSTGNKVRKALEGLIEAKVEGLRNAELEKSLAGDRIDVSLPGSPARAIGHIHPITRTRRMIEDVMVGLGYQVMEGPEVEHDYYNFTALNHPEGHPARMLQDTFYVEDEEHVEQVLLRTHTSPMQVRAMEASPPPLFMIVPGKTYRLEARIRPSVNRPIAGSYAVYLQDTATAPTTQVVLGTFCHSEAPAWVSRSFTFVAPANAASLPVLSFLPVSADTRTTYPGLDDVSLSDVTPCMQP